MPLPGTAGEKARPLTLAVHPFLSASEIYDRFSPLADYLSKRLGRPVSVEISPDYKEHIKMVGTGGADLAYMGPASYVELVRSYGAHPLIAGVEIGGSRTFKGLIVTARDSPVTALSDLAGKSFAFGDPQSTMSHLVPRYMMLVAGVGIEHLASYEFLLNHENVALGILSGSFDAGAVKEEIIVKYGPLGLRVLAETPPLSEHLFVASKGLPEDLVAEMRDVFYGMKHDGEGRAAMTSIKEGMTAMVPVSDREYDSLREIIDYLDKRGIRP